MGKIESKLSAILGERRLKIADLERGAKISYSAAHAMYYGENKMVRLDVLAKVCEFLDVQPGDIYVYVPEDTTINSEESGSNFQK